MNVFVLEDILKNEGHRAVFFSYYGSQWCPKTAWLHTFFRISSFVFRTNTFIQVWSTWGWVNDDWVFIFGCTVPLRLLSCSNPPPKKTLDLRESHGSSLRGRKICKSVNHIPEIVSVLIKCKRSLVVCNTHAWPPSHGAAGTYGCSADSQSDWCPAARR